MNGKLFYADAKLDDLTDLDFVVLVAGDERISSEIAGQRNLRLSEQAKAAAKSCLLLHYTMSPEMYAGLIASISDDKSWNEQLTAYTIKNLSWAIGTCRLAGAEPKAIILASRPPAGHITDAVWLYKTLEKAADLVFKKFSLPVWAEFEAAVVSDRRYDPQRIGETLMARYGDISMREIGEPSKGFTMFGLKDRQDCFWRYANDSAGNVLYLYYGNLWQIVDYHQPASDPGEPMPDDGGDNGGDNNPPDEIALTRLERALKAAALAILEELEK